VALGCWAGARLQRKRPFAPRVRLTRRTSTKHSPALRNSTLRKEIPIAWLEPSRQVNLFLFKILGLLFSLVKANSNF